MFVCPSVCPSHDGIDLILITQFSQPVTEKFYANFRTIGPKGTPLRRLRTRLSVKMAKKRRFSKIVISRKRQKIRI